jgi:long-chain acyl-CoA synthetase
MQDLIAQHKPEERPQIDISPDDTALFQYSGGTTGISKAAIAPHRVVVSNTYQISKWNATAIEGEEVVCLAIPLYHVYGMVAGLNQGILIAAALVMVPDPRDISDVLSNLSKYKATIYPGVPAMYNAINNNQDVLAGKYDLSSIKACISGSAPLMRETKERFEEITGGNLVEGYGLSEAPTASHCNPLQGENRTGSIGLPLPDIDCRIVSVEDGKTDMLIGESGELLLKGPMVMKGYYNMPEETAETLRDGWLHTGDIAKMDEDGYFYILDRKKELIKPGGLQVWPREVEEVIMSHPKVLEAGVAGIPDARSGEAVKAWVVLKQGKTATFDELCDYCRKHMAAYKVPKDIEFIDELPKTQVGKLLRRELQRMHKEKMGV